MLGMSLRMFLQEPSTGRFPGAKHPQSSPLTCTVFCTLLAGPAAACSSDEIKRTFAWADAQPHRFLPAVGRVSTDGTEPKFVGQVIAKSGMGSRVNLALELPLELIHGHCFDDDPCPQIESPVYIPKGRILAFLRLLDGNAAFLAYDCPAPKRSDI